ncbi:hypothetical protein CFT13S00388_07960 [Campylobacter fetus subsp. testudinum]|uniref:ATP-binding protein n=1 Tax=Campylobacter fetus TaxID=196 RepID=UPI000818A7A9|nr:ATP-binding protein [Campylobacter fetus]OCR86680.1 hypothetical protein CFT13S00388_07960 [Campylobacter fetus subsp. testudinum]
MSEKKKLFCEIHNLAYEGVSFDTLGIVEPCPKCKEAREQRKARELKEMEQRAKDEKLAYLLHYLETFSNLPKKYLYEKADLNVGDIARYKGYLETPLQNNLFIFGGIGSGKTLFCTEIVKANVDKAPIYLSGNELDLMRDGDYRLGDIISKIDGKAIVIVDEIQMLIFNKRIRMLDAITDKAYSNGARIVFCGNIEKNQLAILKEAEFKRITSRLKDGRLQMIEFKGRDLRGEI